MKSLTSLWKLLAQDLGERCHVNTALDIKCVEGRTRSEGSSFLTMTLPAYGKAIEKWLSSEQADPADVTGFRSRGGLPLFLRGFLELVFDASSGALLDEPSHEAVLAMRQLCGVYGKMHLPASADRVASAMRAYLDVDDEVEQWEREWDPDGDPELSRLFLLLFGDVLDKVERKLSDPHSAGFLAPRHGPGKTVDRLSGNRKWEMDWAERLEPYFPSVDYILPNAGYYSRLQAVYFRPPGAELPVKVTAVPKTAKTPRLIAIEPTCMQYAQQALARGLVDCIEYDTVVHEFTRFREQEPNQLLAREGSRDGILATLDLSEASDRVSNRLVSHLTSKHPLLNGALQACRSTHARVAIGDDPYIRVISKFASMGSATCFPIEAMVFTTIVFKGIQDAGHERLSLAAIQRFAGQVSIYGDDIIVPVRYVGSVVHALESFGFKVNSSKSFWTGKFRESCGKDYYDGTDVSIVRFRSKYPDNRREVEEVVSLVSFFNQINEAGYTRTANHLRKELVGLFRGNFPRVRRSSDILGEYDDVYQDVIGFDKDLHVPLQKGYVVVPVIPDSPLEDYHALLKWFLKEGDEPFSIDHLLRSGRSSAVNIKLRDNVPA